MATRYIRISLQGKECGVIRVKDITFAGSVYSYSSIDTDMSTLLYIDRRVDSAKMRYEYNKTVIMSPLCKVNQMRRAVLWQRVGNIIDTRK